MFPSTAQKSGTNDAFNLRFEDFLALQPPFLAQKYTFWSYDPRGNARLPCAQGRLKNCCHTQREISYAR